MSTVDSAVPLTLVCVIQDALKLYHTLVLREMERWGGYAVEVADGMCLIAFYSPAAAIRWALSCIEMCLTADWPQELLANEVSWCMELCVCRIFQSCFHGAGEEAYISGDHCL